MQDLAETWIFFRHCLVVAAARRRLLLAAAAAAANAAAAAAAAAAAVLSCSWTRWNLNLDGETNQVLLNQLLGFFIAKKRFKTPLKTKGVATRISKTSFSPFTTTSPWKFKHNYYATRAHYRFSLKLESLGGVFFFVAS